MKFEDVKTPHAHTIPRCVYYSSPGFFVYYELIKRELNKRLIFECRCDTRLKSKTEGSTRLSYTR